MNNKNGWVVLRSASGENVGNVGWGSGAAVCEGSSSSNPGERYSLERYVPGYDTDNNSNDFTLCNTPTPRNSMS